MDIKINYKLPHNNPITVVVEICDPRDVHYKQEHELENSGSIAFFCDFPYNQNVELKISTANKSILSNPLEILSVEFDNFYKLYNFAFRGKNVYDEFFIDHCETNGIYVEAQDDNNVLFFTGALVYTMKRPISSMLHVFESMCY